MVTSRSYIIVTDNLTKIYRLNFLIRNLTKLFLLLYKRICPLLLIIGIDYYINFQQYFSGICAISDCYYHVAKCPPHVQLAGERRKLSGGGGEAKINNASCTCKTSYRSRVSNTSRVFKKSQGLRGLLLEVLRIM